MRVVACHVFVFHCALTTRRCNAFQHIFGIQTMLFLVTMVKCDDKINQKEYPNHNLKPVQNGVVDFNYFLP